MNENQKNKVLENYLNNFNVLVLLDTGYGDGGKAKVSDFLLNSGIFSIFVKTTGGNNSGNTNGEGIVFNSIPVGVGNKNITSILGRGALLNPNDTVDEIKNFEKKYYKIKNLMVSRNSPLVLPHHIELDKKLNSSQKNGGIGSTSKGIGPAYSDFTQRKSLLVKDLLLPKKELLEKISSIENYYKILGNKIKINKTELCKDLIKSSNFLKKYIKDTSKFLNNSLSKNKKVLLMSGQGFDLSIKFGRYPYVTSSDPSVWGSLQGSGISSSNRFKVLNIFQVPLITKVGGGNFLTEIGGIKSKKYCEDEKHTLEFELKKYKISYKKIKNKIEYDKEDKNILKLLNSKDEFIFSVGLRLNKRNYGVTSGRPRRFGWTNLKILKRALEVNGGDVCLTKLDFMEGLSYVKLFFDKETNKTFKIEKNIDFKKIKKYSDFPKGIKKYIETIEKYCETEIKFISIGSKTNDIIIK